MNRRKMLVLLAILPFLGLESASEWFAGLRSKWVGVDLSDIPEQDFSGGERGMYAQLYPIDGRDLSEAQARINELWRGKLDSLTWRVS